MHQLFMFLMAKWYFCESTPLSIHSSMDEHLSCFRFGHIINPHRALEATGKRLFEVMAISIGRISCI